MRSSPAALLVLALGAAAAGLNWGPDVAVDTGRLGAFAVSADSTGQLWAATGAGSRLRLLCSSDAGASWQTRLEHDAGAAVTRVELAAGWGERDAAYLAFLTEAGDGDLWLLRLGRDDTAAAVLPIAVGPDTIDDFSFTLDHDRRYYLYCVTANERRDGLTGFFTRSTDFGASWEPGQSWWNAHDPHLLYVTGSTVHCVWRFAQDGSQIHHQLSRRYGAPGTWEPHRVVARGGYLRWDPRIAQTDTIPERAARLWLVYTRGWRDSSRTDIRFAVGGNDGRPWGDERNPSDPYRDEWFADIATDRWTPHGMASMAYNLGGRGPADSTVVLWRWASAYEPAFWSEPVRVSDRRASAGVPECRPRILYAPNTPLALPLVFFAGYDPVGARGLYCDAPWFAAPGAALPVAVTPNPARDRVGLAFAAPAAGRYTLAVYDCLGRQRFFVARRAEAGAALRLEWDARGAPAGSYVAVARGAGRQWHAMFTLVR